MPQRLTVDDLLARARARIRRLTPEEAFAAAQGAGAVIVDIRTEAQWAADGAVPGAVRIARNVLEWRADPSSAAADPRLADLRLELLVLCHEGYQSSLAAATLRDLGFERAGDVAGGFRAWCVSGLPVEAIGPAAQGACAACGDPLGRPG
jgi:rhodanese-related sulfurtransferase